MSSQVVKLNLDCLELDKGGHCCSLVWDRDVEII